MPDLTENYNFKKPKANEYAKPDDFNENFDALDLILKVLADALENVPEAITIDSELSATSKNPVENKIIYAALALYQKKHIAAAVTLTSSNWSTELTQIVSVAGVTAENTVIVAPSPTSQEAWGKAQVVCAGQSQNALTFSCVTAPTEDITVNIVILGR